MRKVNGSVYMSLDGVVTHPENWTFGFRDDKATQYARDQLFASDALLMGRETYEVFAQVWPTMTDEQGLADRMNSLPKYVVSSTLQAAEWNATIISGDVAREVANLKEQPGQDILIYGYGRLTAELIEHGLLDELRVWLHPLLVGRGGPGDLLLREGTTANMRLLEVQTFGSGLVILNYQPTGPRQAAAE